MTKYSFETIQECEFLFVDKGLTFSSISKAMDGKPSAKTIATWAAKKSSGNKNWFDKKLENRFDSNENFLPTEIADKIQQKMKIILQKDIEEFSLNEARALSVLHKIINEINQTRYGLPYVIYSLRLLTKHLEKNTPELLTEKFVRTLLEFIEKQEKAKQ